MKRMRYHILEPVSLRWFNIWMKLEKLEQNKKERLSSVQEPRIRMTITFTSEQWIKLGEVAKKVYRLGTRGRSQAVRNMIEDTWERVEREVKKDESAA